MDNGAIVYAFLFAPLIIGLVAGAAIAVMIAIPAAILGFNVMVGVVIRSVAAYLRRRKERVATANGADGPDPEASGGLRVAPKSQPMWDLPSRYYARILYA